MVQGHSFSEDNNGSLRPLGNAAGFLLDLQGHTVVTLRLPSEVARELSTEDTAGSGGWLSRLKAKLRVTRETERWLTVAAVDNPFLERLDALRATVAQRLTKATGTEVRNSNLTVCAVVPVNESEDSSEPLG